MSALISHTDPCAAVAYVQGRAVAASEYLAAVRHMASRLPAHGHVLNLCSSRYHFAVVMGAALLRRQPMLLPSTRTRDMLAQLRQHYAALHAVVDQPDAAMDLPQIRFESPADAGAVPFDVPQIDDDQVAAYVFTSGSTGQPVPHIKHWGLLVRGAHAEGQRVRGQLGRLSAGAVPFTVTGTVPAQHMYGFESTILMPLQNQAALDDSHPFFPADIAAALRRTPAPRVLVITPFHLRTLLESQVGLPGIALLLSATAPLSPQLARQAEQTLAAPLLEIYGSTETGQMAMRRTATDQLWQAYDGIEVQAEGSTEKPRFFAQGGHLEGKIPLNDVLELHTPCVFDLLGRHADMVNIAGRRTSLAYLNHQLNSIPGVQDGAFYWPASDNADAPHCIQRPIAFVVAPSLSEAELAHALRERIDPVFMPRPIHFFAQLPRNATGKLPQQALAELAQSRGAASHD